MKLFFTQDDLKIFSIPDFSGRMGAIKTRIRPKLEAIGEALGPELLKAWGEEFFAHTAKHMRRTVNPPDETWVAFGPKPRGYKANIHLALCIGTTGAQARVIMKSESELRPVLGRNLKTHLSFFKKHQKEFYSLRNYLRKDDSGEGEAIDDLEKFLAEQGRRLVDLKSATFDVGFPLKPGDSNLVKNCLQAFKTLKPLYLCGVKPGGGPR